MFARPLIEGTPLLTRHVLRGGTQVRNYSKRISQELLDKSQQEMDQAVRDMQKSEMLVSSGSRRDSLSTKRLLLITGATGQMGPGFIEEGVRRGYHVRACTRNPSKYVETPYVKYVQTPEDKLTEAAYWEEFMEEHGAEFEEVVFLNLLGASVAPKGKTLEEINLIPVTSAMEAMTRFRNRYGKRCSFQHLSSIAATVMGDTHPYSKTRKLADEILLEIAQSHGISFTAVRPGLIFNDLREKCMIHMGHAYSPEQLAALPLHLVLGSGKQIQQPVFEGDLFEAMLNAAEMEHQIIVDAVGPEAMTQREMFQFFADLANKKFRPLHIPTGVAKAIAEHCPKGRFAPYAMQLFESLECPKLNKPLCDKNFRMLVGRDTLSMRKVYYIEGDQKIVLARTPVLEHAMEIAAKMIGCSTARSHIMGAIWSHKFDLIKGALDPSHYESRVQEVTE